MFFNCFRVKIIKILQNYTQPILKDMYMYFFGLNPDAELFKLTPHKKSWILQSLIRFGDYYFRKYNNSEVILLIRQIIKRYDLKKNLDIKDKIYLVTPKD